MSTMYRRRTGSSCRSAVCHPNIWRTLFGLLIVCSLTIGQSPRPAAASRASHMPADLQSQSLMGAGDQYDILRERWKAMLTGGASVNQSDAQIAARLSEIGGQAKWLWQQMNVTTGRTYLWSDLASPTNPDHITASYDRLRMMALGYATVGSTMYHNAALSNAIIGGLDWMYTYRYNWKTKMVGNWWYWEIGTPLVLNDITVMMYDELKARKDWDRVSSYMSAVDHFTPDVPNSGPSSTAANRVWKATIIAVRGAIVKDSAKLSYARDAVRPVFAYVTSRDGFYSDGSFIQHLNIAYTGGYGVQLLGNLADLMYLVEGSSWEIPDDLKQNTYQWIYDSFEPLIYRGAFMDLARGRNIASPKVQDHEAGHEAIEAIIRLSQVAPAPHADAFKRMVKYWLQSDTYKSFFVDRSIDMIELAEAILANGAISSRGELVKHKTYPIMARSVHLRPGFAFGVSMFGNRIANYEYNNGENAKGWYTGDGMTSLYTNDLSQYSDGYWATIDMHRLPGTTVSTRSLQAGEGSDRMNSKSWVGGSQILGLYGTAGMDLEDVYSRLVGRKSWFMFDNEVVALGAGISNTDGQRIETIIENRKLNAAGNNALTVNSTASIKPSTLGWSETMGSVKWAQLDGTAGYYFPTAVTLKGLRAARTGSWAGINAPYGSATPLTRNFLTLWLDQGINPTNASYAYAILPNMTSAQVSAYAANPQFTILANSADVQAVKETTLGIVGANFWTDGPKTVGNFLSSDKRASVMTQETASTIEIAVSNPTQTNIGTVNLEVQRSARSVISYDPAIVVTQLSPTIKLAVNVNGKRGETLKVKLALGTFPAPTPTPDPNAPIVADDFNRQVSAGWGWAPTGGAYTLIGGAAKFAVDKAGGASMAVSAASQSSAAELPQVSVVSSDSTFTLSSDKLATGSGQYVYAVARSVARGTEYLGRMRFGPDGGVYLQIFRNIGYRATAVSQEVRVTGLRHQPGAVFHLRFQAVGANPTTLRLRAWAAGSAEPSTWLASVTDATAALQKAGSIGLQSALASGATNAPVVFKFDNWRVWKP